MKVQKLTPVSARYPECLRNIASVPKALYILGDIEPLLARPRLAVVGSRKVTPYGKLITSQLSKEAAGKGVVIVSGLALGVDALAHTAALEAGGHTIAVMPCGLDTIYPATNRQLAKRILSNGGALISEYPFGTEPFKSNFVARSRIVSGISDAVLITEAAEKSGTLHTANFALEQGRTVMAVPGNITSPLSAGTNNLIKVGALPVTNINDILLALGLHESNEAYEVLAASKEEADILQLLKDGMTDASLLCATSGMDPRLFNQTLTMLEINGKIRALGAGHWSIN
ncbi:MAG: hypothetical protein JWL85_520 [Candidatus Saccharibacteria bacterium]|nr:hypothetical protein [Candidatus Saccharibacteria bacterium]